MVAFVRVRDASVAVVLAAGLASCSGSTPGLLPSLGNAPQQDEAKVEPGAKKPEAAKKDAKPACKTTETCAGVLRKLVDNPNRAWVGKAQPPAAYDDGTRLFAYRALRPKLTCAELARAIDETRAAMREAQGTGHASSRALMTQVNAELRSERQHRCKATAKAQ
jgi:hypothetical protein